MNGYIKIAKVADFEHISLKSYRILARHIGIFKQKDGTFYAMEVGCKHQNADVTQGHIDQDNVATCPWHGWKYDLTTGECVWGAKTFLRRYGLKIEGEDIYVSIKPMEDPEPEEDEGDFFNHEPHEKHEKNTKERGRNG